MGNEFDFEKPLIDLENKIKDLKQFSEEKKIDLTDQIVALEKQAKEMQKIIYGNMTAWGNVQIARHPQRPISIEYINTICPDFMELHGDRNFRDDQSIVGGIGSIDGRPVTIIGYMKGRDTKENLKRNFGMPHPEGYRKALRLMKQAEKFHRPVISLIDTPGAYPGIAAEERGQGEAIARNIMEMANLKTPIICVVIGEGGSGGALAVGVGNKVAMLEHSIYSVSSPEACAAILWKNSAKAKEAAEILKITANDLLELGVIDASIPEPPGGAHRNMDEAAANLKEFLVDSLDELSKMSEEELIEQRYAKLRAIGKYEE